MKSIKQLTDELSVIDHAKMVAIDQYSHCMYVCSICAPPAGNKCQ